MLNANGYGAAWSSNSGHASELIRHYAGTSGTWKIGVNGKTGTDWSNNQPYDLRVDVCGGPDDPQQPGAGDSPFWPAQLTPGVPRDGWICPQGDEDWYEFTVPPGQATINVKLSNLPKNYMVSLYDPGGMPRATSQQDGPPEETLTYTAINQPGQWQVAVRGLPRGSPAWDAVNPYRLLVTVPPLPDFTILGVETVQVTQNTTGTISLVADKATMVRVYVDIGAAAGPIPNVEVQLRGWKDAEFVGVLTRTGTLGKFSLADARLDLSRSINFILPTSWLSAGSLHLSAKVNPSYSLPETNYANNNLSTMGKLYTASPANVWLVQVEADNLIPADNDPDLLTSLGFLHDIFPIPYVQIWGVPNYTLVANYNYVTSGTVCQNGWNDLLDDLQDLYDNWKNRPANATIYGYMDQAVNSPFVGGCGHPGVAAGKLGTNDNATMAHEVGHAYRLDHAPCGNPCCLDPGWPYDTNPNAIIGEVGVRPAAGTSGQLFNPNSTRDLMSYCSPQWFSPHNYKKLLAITAPSAPASTAQASGPTGESQAESPTYEHRSGEQTYLIVAGRLAEDGSLRLRPFWTNTFAGGQYDGAGEGPYAIELRGGAGQVLFVRRFDPLSGLQGGDHEIGYFHEILPYPSGVRHIVFSHGEQIVAQVPVSAHPPTARFLNPHGGEFWQGAGPFAVSWDMSDEDGGSLTAQILYSRDGGENWLPVAVNLRESHVLLNGRILPGSQRARLRLRVTDGVNTVEADSEMFRVSRKAPLALITRPQTAAIYPPGEPILLNGLGSDSEDGALGDEALVWSSNLDGRLGAGRSLFVDWLTPGAHTITLTARDSDGQAGAASLRIFVGLPMQLPMILRQ